MDLGGNMQEQQLQDRRRGTANRGRFHKSELSSNEGPMRLGLEEAESHVSALTLLQCDVSEYRFTPLPSVTPFSTEASRDAVVCERTPRRLP